MSIASLRSSLPLRIGLTLALPVALALALFGLQVHHERRAEMVREARREATDLGTALEVALDAFLRDRALADLAELTEDLSRAERVLGVVVFDADARPTHWSRSVAGEVARVAGVAERALRRRSVEGVVLEAPGRRTVYVHAVPIEVEGGRAPRAVAVTLRDLAYIDRQLREQDRQLALVGVAITTALVVVLWFALRRAVLVPIATLARSAARVGGGELEGEVPIERDDEVGRLGRTFNAMLRSLRDARAELQAQANAKVALERRLQHAQRLALIGQLSANLAHRIGSPLNVVLGRAQYALGQPRDAARDARHFEEIRRGAEQISTVIEGLLKHARRVRGVSEAFDLRELVVDCARFLEVECARAGVTLSIEGERHAIVKGIREEMEQVVLSLSLNAIQAQPTGGALRFVVTRVESDAAPPRVRLAVEDRGPGVAPELREAVFEPFFTTKGPREGTGLGLSICEEAVRAHGGTIRCEANEPGGARFVVELAAA